MKTKPCNRCLLAVIKTIMELGQILEQHQETKQLWQEVVSMAHLQSFLRSTMRRCQRQRSSSRSLFECLKIRNTLQRSYLTRKAVIKVRCHRQTHFKSLSSSLTLKPNFCQHRAITGYISFALAVMTQGISAKMTQTTCSRKFLIHILLQTLRKK